MARTIQEIKKEMTDDFIDNGIVIEKYDLAPREEEKSFEEQFSKVSLESLLFYIFANEAQTLETLFDTHRDAVSDMILTQRPHTIGWYRQTALNFQYERDLRSDLAEYDNTGLSDEEITKERIVTKCSVTKAEFIQKPTLIVKVAKADSCLDKKEEAAFKAYMEAKADAGVHLRIITGEPDRLWLSLIIRHDGLVVDDNGNCLLNSEENPVKEAIKKHLNNLVFNGTFYPSLLEQELMQLPGIKIATVWVSKAAPYSTQKLPQQELPQFVDKYQPMTGALKIDLEEDLHVEYELF